MSDDGAGAGRGVTLGFRGSRGIVVVAAFIAASCAAPSARGVHVEFFPGPLDDALQDAAHGAVLGVLARNGGRMLPSASPWDVRALIALDCGRDGLVADLRFTRSAGPQAIAVRFCRVGASTEECAPGSDGMNPPDACRRRTDRLLSTIERQLTEHLLARVRLASADDGRWWDDPTLGSLAALVSQRGWRSSADAATRPGAPSAGSSSASTDRGSRSSASVRALASPLRAGVGQDSRAALRSAGRVAR